MGLVMRRVDGGQAAHTRGHNPRTTQRTFGARDLVQGGLAIPVGGPVVPISLRGGQGGHDDERRRPCLEKGRMMMMSCLERQATRLCRGFSNAELLSLCSGPVCRWWLGW